jgi:hypothetical protein
MRAIGLGLLQMERATVTAASVLRLASAGLNSVSNW